MLLSTGAPVSVAPIIGAVLPLVLAILFLTQHCVMLLILRLQVALNTTPIVIAIIAIALLLLLHLFELV